MSHSNIPYHLKKNFTATQSEMVILIIGESRRAGVGYDLDNFRLSKNWKTTVNCDKPNLQYADGAGKYRFGFNGAERLDAIYGEGNGYDLGARMYNPRLGKMFSTDPREAEYAWQSTYAYYGNSPIYYLDLNGESPGLNRFLGGVQFLGGVVEGLGAAALLAAPEPTMLTKVAGWGLALHSSDVMSTGLRQLWSGKIEMSVTHQGLMAIGLSDNQAMLVDASLGLAAGGGAYAKVDKMLKAGTITRNSYHSGLSALRKTGDEMISNGASYEEVVKLMVPARNNLKGMVRLADDGVNKTVVEIRNFFKYGDKLGPSVDDVTKNFKVDGKVDWKAAYENLWKTSEKFDKFK